MSRITTKNIPGGKAKYLKDSSVKREMGRRAAAYAKIAGGDGATYESDSYTGRNRARGSVMARTFKARRHNARTNAIIKAVAGNPNV